MSSSDGDVKLDPSVAPNAVLVSEGADAATLRLTGVWRLSFIERIAMQLSALKLPAKFVIGQPGVETFGRALAYSTTSRRPVSRARSYRLRGERVRIVEQCAALDTHARACIVANE